MPYCPKCDMEFVEGVSFCSDCKGPLLSSPQEAKALQEEAEKKAFVTIFLKAVYRKKLYRKPLYPKNLYPKNLHPKDS